MVKEWSVILTEKRKQLEQADDKTYKMRQQKESLETFISKFKEIFQQEKDLLEEELALSANTDIIPFLSSEIIDMEDLHYKRYRTLLAHQETFETSLKTQSNQATKIEKELTALEKEARL